MAKKKKTSLATPRIIHFIICDGVVRDASKKTTVYGIFDRIITSTVPTTANFFIYTKITGGSGKHKISFEIKGSNGKPIKQPWPTFEVDLTSKVFDIIMQVVAAKFPRFGDYTVQPVLSGKAIGTPLAFRVIKPEVPKIETKSK